MSKYAKEQIEEVIKANQDNEFDLRLVIRGETKATNNLNITDEDAQKIADMLAVPSEPNKQLTEQQVTEIAMEWDEQKVRNVLELSNDLFTLLGLAEKNVGIRNLINGVYEAADKRKMVP